MTEPVEKDLIHRGGSVPVVVGKAGRLIDEVGLGHGSRGSPTTDGRQLKNGGRFSIEKDSPQHKLSLSCRKADFSHSAPDKQAEFGDLIKPRSDSMGRPRRQTGST
jgi:hypothetical protein